MNQDAIGTKTPRSKVPESGRGFGPSTMARSVRWHRGSFKHTCPHPDAEEKRVCSLQRSCPRWLEVCVDAIPLVYRPDLLLDFRTPSRMSQKSSLRTTSPSFTALLQLCLHQNLSQPLPHLPCSAHLPSHRIPRLPSPTLRCHPSPALR